MSFLRQNTVNVLKYLPEFLQSDVNFKSVGDTCSHEHEKIRLLVQDVFNQFFVESATWGLPRYERVLDIVPKAADDYTARRNRILSRYQSNQTTTIAFLETLIKRYLSTDSIVNVVENNPDYSFRIVTTGGSILYFEDMIEAINLYKPAHLAIEIDLNRTDQTQLYVGGAAFIGGMQQIGLHRTTQLNGGLYVGIAHQIGGLQTVSLHQTRQQICGLYVGAGMHCGGTITVLPKGGI